MEKCTRGHICCLGSFELPKLIFGGIMECEECQGTGKVKDLILLREIICECIKKITETEPIPPEFELTFQKHFHEILSD